MTIYYLMVKTHQKTGLKYLCQTKKKNYENYSGSGHYWKIHLKEHGPNYTTELLIECHSKEELRKCGLYYSKLWNVVESSEWANLIPETGTGAMSGKFNRGRKHELVHCEFCGGMIPKNTTSQHKSSCIKNPERSPINTKKHPTTQCFFCNSPFDKYQLSVHEKICLQNPHRDNHVNKGMIYEKYCCIHCDKQIGSTAIKRHETTCNKNPNKKKSFTCKISTCEHCGLSGSGGNMKRFHHDNCKKRINTIIQRENYVTRQP